RHATTREHKGPREALNDWLDGLGEPDWDKVSQSIYDSPATLKAAVERQRQHREAERERKAAEQQRAAEQAERDRIEAERRAEEEAAEQARLEAEAAAEQARLEAEVEARLEHERL